MKCISWNVNGLRACVNKGFVDYFKAENADVFALQETKLQEGQIELPFEGYYQTWNYAEKKGYSGTAVFSKEKPLNVIFDFEQDHPKEGRVIALEFDKYYFVVAYVPNSKNELKRLDYRMQWEDDLRNHLMKLDKHKPVVYCGDLNVAHEEIDIKNPKTNRRSAGFTDEERQKMTELLASGFKDTFRVLYPDIIKYSWWSYRFNARANNTGWRIDYFIVSDRIMSNVVNSEIDTHIEGSDHCPVKIEINL